MTLQFGMLTHLARNWQKLKYSLEFTSSYQSSVLIHAKRVKQTQISHLPSVPLTLFLSASRFLLLVLMFCFGYLLIDLLIYIFLFDVCLRPLRLCQQGMARRKNSEQT